MHYFVFFLGCTLLRTAFTLQCYDCKPATEPCNKTDCATQCGAMQGSTFKGQGREKIYDVTAKFCAKTPGDCTAGSANFGFTRTTLNSECCNSTDLCNANTPGDRRRDSRNGRRCWTLPNGRDDLDREKIACEGNEVWCITATVGAVLMKGCASELMCSDAISELTPGLSINCCQGDMCNHAQAFGASLLLLVASVFAAALFN